MSFASFISTIKSGFTDVESAIANGLVWLRTEAAAAIPGLKTAEADVQAAEGPTAEVGSVVEGAAPQAAATVSGIELGEVILTKVLGLLVAGAEALADGGMNVTLDKNVVLAAQTLLHPVANAAIKAGAPAEVTTIIAAAVPVQAPAAAPAATT